MKDDNSYPCMQFMYLRFRYHVMRLLSVLILSFFNFNLSAQESSCIPTLNVKAIICPFKGDSVLNKLCPPGYHDLVRGVRASDRNYSIISFKISGDKLCSESLNNREIQNTGSEWNEARLIINAACNGSIIKITCVKAKDKEGRIHILQPLTAQLSAE